MDIYSIGGFAQNGTKFKCVAMTVRARSIEEALGLGLIGLEKEVLASLGWSNHAVAVRKITTKWIIESLNLERKSDD